MTEYSKSTSIVVESRALRVGLDTWPKVTVRRRRFVGTAADVSEDSVVSVVLPDGLRPIAGPVNPVS